MDTVLLPATQLPLIELNPALGIPLGQRLLVFESNGQRAVFVGGMAIHVYDARDRGAEAAAIALLAHARVAPDVALAEAFGVHRNTVGRLERRLEEAGMAGVVPAKPGPKGPHKVTPAVREVVQELAHLGSVRLARAIEQRTGVRLSAQHVRALRQQARAAAVPLALWSEPREPEPVAALATVATAPAPPAP